MDNLTPGEIILIEAIESHVYSHKNRITIEIVKGVEKYTNNPNYYVPFNYQFLDMEEQRKANKIDDYIREETSSIVLTILRKFIDNNEDFFISNIDYTEVKPRKFGMLCLYPIIYGFVQML